MSLSLDIGTRAQIETSVRDAINTLDKGEVVHVAYSIRPDSTDELSIFFRIVLTDAASKEDRLAAVSNRTTSHLIHTLHPCENWNLTPYFSFRSHSE